MADNETAREEIRALDGTVIGTRSVEGVRTLRDEFAMAALTNMASPGGRAVSWPPYKPHEAAEAAYAYADAMVEARRK